MVEDGDGCRKKSVPYKKGKKLGIKLQPEDVQELYLRHHISNMSLSSGSNTAILHEVSRTTRGLATPTAFHAC